jgi:hypothetical protein
MGGADIVIAGRVTLADLDAASRYGSHAHSTSQPVDNSGDNLGETPPKLCTQPVENCGILVNYTS